MNDNVEKWLVALEEEIRSAKRPMLSPNLKLVDENKCLEYISEIRYALPNEMAQARAVVQERDETIAQARAKASDIIAQAEAQADDILNNHRIIGEAERERKEMLIDAQRNAEEMYMKAADSSLNLLEEVENHLRNALKEISIGKQNLS